MHKMNSKRMCWHLNCTPHVHVTEHERKRNFYNWSQFSIYLIAFHNYIISHLLISLSLLFFFLWLFLVASVSSLLFYCHFFLPSFWKYFILRLEVKESRKKRGTKETWSEEGWCSTIFMRYLYVYKIDSKKIDRNLQRVNNAE